MARVIVTGASGFVGANLTRRLLADGHDVHLVLRPTHAAWRIDELRQHLSVQLVDLADAAGVQRSLDHVRPEWVFHLAAYGAYSAQSDVPAMIQTNILGTVHLVEASLRCGAEAIVMTGSSSEYGFKGGAPSEEAPAEPNSAYAITKLAATQLCRELARGGGARLTTLRLYSVFGPWEEPTRLVPRLLVRALDGGLPPLADPRTARDFVFVDDAVDAYLRAASQPHTQPGGIFNVGTGVQTSLRALVSAVLRITGAEAEPVWGAYPDRAWDTDTWVADSRRIGRELGWTPRFTLEDGLRATLEWFRAHPDQLARYQRAACLP